MEKQFIQPLSEAALAARQHAYALYSQFQVGAAILTSEGNIVSGANVENASYSLTLCAERVAAAAAITAGHKQLEAIAIASPGGAPPCGACRQFLAEFNSNIDILLVDSNDAQNIQETTLAELLPQQFKLADN